LILLAALWFAAATPAQDHQRGGECCWGMVLP